MLRALQRADQIPEDDSRPTLWDCSEREEGPPRGVQQKDCWVQEGVYKEGALEEPKAKFSRARAGGRK